MSTTKALRLALAAAAFCAAASTTADAKPRRVVVLDLDGPRTLADSGRSAIVSVLGEASYDVISSKRWTDAKANVGRKVHGPALWSKAAKAAGVDAVIDGWVQEEGRTKVLTVVVTDASNGNVFDQLTIRLGSKGITEEIERKLKQGLEDRFDWIEPTSTGGVSTYDDVKVDDVKVKDKRKIGAKRPADDDEATTEDTDRPRARRDREDRDDRSDRRDRRRSDREDRDDRDDRRGDDRRSDDRRRDDRDDEMTEKKPARVATIETKKETKEDKETNILASVFKPVTEEEDIVTGGKASHISKPTAKFRVGGGFKYGSRSLAIGAENPDGVTQYASVPNKALALDATFYPFPTKKMDGILSGVGFSFAIDKSVGSTVTFDDLDTVGDYSINQYSWHAGVHYRAALSESFAIDGEVGYGQSAYKIVDAPMTFEVPDTAYSFLTAGGSLDLKITERATVGFGAKYLYTLDTGDLNSTDWYGPGGSSGFGMDANVVIPLPSNLYLRAELAYTRVKTSFDGVGVITEEEGVTEAIDSTVSGGLKLGIQF
ncbi:MAG: hypothetical protein ABI867_03465 [Kofleriaceae bacterium]